MPTTQPSQKFLSAVCRAVVELLHSNLNSLSDAAEGSIKKLSERMFCKDLISEPVKNKPDLTMGDLLGSIKSDIKLVKTKSRLDEILEDFYEILIDTGGPLKIAADVLQDAIEEKIREVAVQHTARANSLPDGKRGSQTPPVSKSQSLPAFVTTNAATCNEAGQSLADISEHTLGNDSSFSITGTDVYGMEPESQRQSNGSNSSPLHFTTSSKSGILLTDPESSIIVPGIDKIAEGRELVGQKPTYTRTSSGYDSATHLNEVNDHSLPPTAPPHGSCQQESVDYPTQVMGGISPSNNTNKHEHVNVAASSSSSVKPLYSVPSPTTNCSSCEARDKKEQLEQQEKISKLETTVDRLQTEKETRFDEEQRKVDITRDKLQEDRQLLEKREREFDEERKKFRDERREEEQEWRKRQKDLYEKNEQCEDEYQKKVKKVEEEKEEWLLQYKKKLDDENNDKLKLEMEKMKKEQRRSLGLNRSLSRESRRKMEEESRTKADREKEDYIMKKDEEMALRLADLAKEQALLAEEKKRVHQKEADLRKQQIKLDAKEIALVTERTAFDSRKTKESKEMLKESQKLNKSKQEQKLKWAEYWEKERDIQKREKIVAKRETNETQPLSSEYKGIHRTTFIVLLLLTLMFSLIYGFITS